MFEMEPFDSATPLTHTNKAITLLKWELNVCSWGFLMNSW